MLLNCKAEMVLWQHRAVMEPVSRRLWLIGGVDAQGDTIADIKRNPYGVFEAQIG